MHIVHVHIHVDADRLEEFRKATFENARNSLQEPGVLRFDVLQEADDPTRFVLVEIYRTPEDQGKHRDTAHYKAWRASVDSMMAEPRTGVRLTKIFPPDEG